jgi:hypothetical protein
MAVVKNHTTRGQLPTPTPHNLTNKTIAWSYWQAILSELKRLGYGD